jgi:putative CocE/NonD family hydrolase
MSGVDQAGWRVSPQAYLAQRRATFAAPSAPSSCYVSMSDGCRLAVDVYVPVGEVPSGGFPTIAIFTPYLRRFAVIAAQAEPSPNAARYRDFFLQYGYALVVVDVRGTGASFGMRDSFRSPREREDSREIADWIVSQSWSNGVIGSTGISYLGAAACFLASTGHPAVKAIAPLFSVSDIYAEQLYPGGMMSRVWSRAYDELMVALDGNDVALRARYPYFNDPRLAGPQPVDEDGDGLMLAQALAEHRNNFRLHDLLPEWSFREQGALHDPELTTDICSPFHYLKAGAQSNLPIYSISGWYDGGGYANGAISRFLTMGGPQDRLLIGPWDHGARTDISPWRTSAVPQFPVLGEVLRFFDSHLLGMQTGIEDEAPVHYFSVHAETWHAAPAWPPLNTTTGISPIRAGFPRRLIRKRPMSISRFALTLVRANTPVGKDSVQQILIATTTIGMVEMMTICVSPPMSARQIWKSQGTSSPN